MHQFVARRNSPFTLNSTFFTSEIDDNEAETSNLKCKVSADSVVFFGDEIAGSLRYAEAARGYLFTVRLKNTSQRLIKIGNVVPLGRGNDRVYITGEEDTSGLIISTAAGYTVPDMAP